MIHLIIGGARSGKSTYAEKCAIEVSKQRSTQVLYLATAIVTDVDMAVRIEKHRSSRPQIWATIERYKGFDAMIHDVRFIEAGVMLLDCLTIMMTNLMFDAPIDYETTTPEALDCIEENIWSEITTLIEVSRLYDKTLIIVSNEVGMGLVPPYKLGNYFRDISGRMNQRIAKIADEVTFVAVGLPLKLKGGH